MERQRWHGAVVITAAMLVSGCVDVEESTVPSVRDQMAAHEAPVATAPPEPDPTDTESPDGDAGALDEATVARIAEIDDECRRVAADMDALEQAQADDLGDGPLGPTADDQGPQLIVGEASYWYDLRELQREVSDQLEAAAAEDDHFTGAADAARQVLVAYTEVAYAAQEQEDPEPALASMIEALDDAESAAADTGFEVCFRSEIVG